MSSQFYNKVLLIAAVFGLVGVITGAFGAHFLKSRIEPTSLDALKTGVLYLFVHTAVILYCTWLGTSNPASRIIKSSATLFIIGILCFSGSLFIISTASLTGFPARYIGPVTPLGGLCFVAGWALLFWYALRQKA